MLIWVGVAAAVVAVAAVLTINFSQRIAYATKVNGKLGETSDTLTKSLDATGGLMKNVDALKADTNLAALRVDSNDTAFQVVLDALPTTDDRTALGASLQKILGQSGATIESLNVTDNGGEALLAEPAASGAATSVKPEVQPAVFSVTISGDYDTIKTALLHLERTLRTINITDLTLQGKQGRLEATINATTYFAPKVNYVLGSEEVTP
jgi:Tfp pilus assembly protein PilO